MATHYRYLLRLSYNGNRYLGWQVQPQKPTVQETLNRALAAIFRTDINVVGCGRTDTGVHAREFYAHFDHKAKLPTEELKSTLKKLNGFLPEDIALYNLMPVPSNLHARFSASSRTYKYQISTQKNPFQNPFAYYFFSPLDVDKMNQAASLLKEYQDFTSFSKVNTQVKTNNCKILHAQWEMEDDLLVFTVQADRFLRNMVRAIVGTLLDVGRLKTSLEQFVHIIESRDRSAAGFSVPAHGLFLHRVEYPKGSFSI
jgi:tRNA pseudouridine38-40 synthase